MIGAMSSSRSTCATGLPHQEWTVRTRKRATPTAIAAQLGSEITASKRQSMVPTHDAGASQTSQCMVGPIRAMVPSKG